MENQLKMDCGGCAQVDSCPVAQEKGCKRGVISGYFCPKWHNQTAARRGCDPNERWRRGFDSDFGEMAGR